MSSEEKPMTAREQLAQGWELAEQSMALVGPIPYCKSLSENIMRDCIVFAA
jgi:hypothetical protein